MNCHKIFFQHFDVDDEGKPSCEYADCPLSPSARFFTKTKKTSWIFDVSRYAKSFGLDNSVWIQEFSRVYYKMLMNGYSKLKKVR